MEADCEGGIVIPRKKPEEGSIERTVCQGGETWTLRDGTKHVAEPGDTRVRVYTGGEWVEAEWGDTYMDKLVLPKRAGKLELSQQFVGGLRLIRGWNINGGELRSLSASFAWTPGVLVASDAYGSDAPPTMGGNSHVGFFGFYDWKIAQQQLPGHVMGTYLGWGRCVRGTQGFRCEYAKVEALAEPEPGDHLTPTAVAEVAEKYGIPMLPRDELMKLKTGLVKMTADMVYDKYEEKGDPE